MVKSWKTSTVGMSQLVLGLIAFGLFAFGKIDYLSLGGSIGFIVWIGGIVGNMFAKDSNVSHSIEDLGDKSKATGARRPSNNTMPEPDGGGNGTSEEERD